MPNFKCWTSTWKWLGGDVWHLESARPSKLHMLLYTTTPLRIYHTAGSGQPATNLNLKCSGLEMPTGRWALAPGDSWLPMFEAIVNIHHYFNILIHQRSSSNQLEQPPNFQGWMPSPGAWGFRGSGIWTFQNWMFGPRECSPGLSSEFIEYYVCTFVCACSFQSTFERTSWCHIELFTVGSRYLQLKLNQLTFQGSELHFLPKKPLLQTCGL